jgi:hypothetical protein
LAGYKLCYSHGDETDAQPTDDGGGNISCQQIYGQADHQATYEKQATDSFSTGKTLFSLDIVIAATNFF